MIAQAGSARAEALDPEQVLGARRYVVFPAMQLLGALLVLQSLEFLPHRAERVDTGTDWHPGVSGTGR
jgi:hypothetical protein